MAHGFSGVKEMRLDRFAEVFAAAGLASVVFDYRGLGASDGEPRQDIDPQAQLRDYRNAISWARRRPEIDPERIGVWGSSYSGGHALMLGALDRRVRAVVAQVPLIDAYEWLGRAVGDEERRRADRGADRRTRAPLRRRRAGDDPGRRRARRGARHPRRGRVVPTMAALAPTWRNEVTLRSWERILEYSPLRWIDRVAPTPLLIIAAEQDVICPLDLAREAFARAGEPKRLGRVAGRPLRSLRGSVLRGRGGRGGGVVHHPSRRRSPRAPLIGRAPA